MSGHRGVKASCLNVDGDQSKMSLFSTHADDGNTQLRAETENKYEASATLKKADHRSGASRTLSTI